MIIEAKLFSEKIVRRKTKEGGALQAITKELVEIHFLLTRSLFGAGTPRRLFLRVSATKLTSVALPSRQLRKTKPQLASRRQPYPREGRREAGAVRRRTTVLQIF
jgi:hypothetical protein